MTPDPLLVTLPEAAALLRVSLRTVKTMVSDGRLSSVKVGRRRLIRYDELRRMVDSLPGSSPQVPLSS